jgi:hypothetical protein
MRSYKHIMKHHMPAKAQEHIIGITQHRMSICRGNSRMAQAMTVREAKGSRQKRLSVWGWTDSPILENGGNVRLKSTNYWERKRHRHGLHKLASNK